MRHDGNVNLALQLYLQGDSYELIVSKLNFASKQSKQYIAELEVVLDICYVEDDTKSEFVTPREFLESNGYPTSKSDIDEFMDQLVENSLIQKSKSRSWGEKFVPTIWGIQKGIRIYDEDELQVAFPKGKKFQELIDYLGTFDLVFGEP